MSVVFAPLLPLAVLLILAVLLVGLIGLAFWRGLRGWAWRGLAGAIVLLALGGPSLQKEQRQALGDIVVVLVDESESQGLADRGAQLQASLEHLTRQIEAIPTLEMRLHRFGTAPEEAGTTAMKAMAEALSQVPKARLAGVILLSDGRVHDMGATPDLPAPLHLLLTGQARDWDRRLIIKNAPAFAIIGEEVSLTLKIEDQGAVPAEAGSDVLMTITVDAQEPQTYRVPIGQEIELPISLPHGGVNVLQFEMAATAGELTTRNNAALIQINGIRDRLRVLLVSGEPHAGERVWRNLLKSDASVDLVHFTILRPPEKQDGVPVDELSLIAFPTRELFVEKLPEFDLVIFDRYRMRGILPLSYIQNIVDYVKGGGTVLVASGPEFGAVDSLYHTPLAEILPVAPTAQVLEGAFYPKITDLGRRHPVTRGLDSYAPLREDGNPPWGRWLRAIEVSQLSGQTVMEGPQGQPLLVLDRVEQGRIAALNSDHAWLWGRGYEGGGPQLELLRRLAHWMLKEPQLEEETLSADVVADGLLITRRSLSDSPPEPLVITGPDGVSREFVMQKHEEGEYRLLYKTETLGLYRLKQGDLARVIGLGPAAPKEFEQTIASGEVFEQAAQKGQLAALSVSKIHEGLPKIRMVSLGGPMSGRGWIGLTPREAYTTLSVDLRPLMPLWLWLLLAAGISLIAWLREGRSQAIR